MQLTFSEMSTGIAYIPLGKKESYLYGTLQKKQEIAIVLCAPEKKRIYNKNDGVMFQKCEQSVY